MALSREGGRQDYDGRRVIHAAIDAGITFIDTADVYCLNDGDLGHNERLIASAIRQRRDRDSIHIATKAGLRRPGGQWTRDGTPKHIREACEKSLLALGVEEIWLYQFHSPDPSVPFQESIEAFAELQRQGKVLYVGLSNVSVKQIEQASHIVDVRSVQNRLSPYFRENLDVVEECGRRQITFLAYSPVGGARLAQRIPKVSILHEIARKHHRSPHAVVLAWVRAKGSTVVPIPGATKPEHAVDSAKSVSVTLSAKEIAAIDGTEFPRT